MDKSNYICYCNKITYDEIISSIKNGNNTLDKIRKDTGACMDGNCKINNPIGKCCSAVILKIFKDYKEKRTNS